MHIFFTNVNAQTLSPTSNPVQNNLYFLGLHSSFFPEVITTDKIDVTLCICTNENYCAVLAREKIVLFMHWEMYRKNAIIIECVVLIKDRSIISVVWSKVVISIVRMQFFLCSVHCLLLWLYYWASCGVADLLVNERQSIHDNKRKIFHYNR